MALRTALVRLNALAKPVGVSATTMASMRIGREGCVKGSLGQNLPRCFSGAAAKVTQAGSTGSDGKLVESSTSTSQRSPPHQVKPIPQHSKVMTLAGGVGLISAFFVPEHADTVAALSTIVLSLGLASGIPAFLDPKSLVIRHEQLLKSQLQQLDKPTSGIAQLVNRAKLAATYLLSRRSIAKMVQRSQDDSRLGRYLVYNLGWRLSKSRLIWEHCGRETVLGAPLQFVEQRLPSGASLLTVSLPVINARLGQRGVLNIEVTIRKNPYCADTQAVLSSINATSEPGKLVDDGQRAAAAATATSDIISVKEAVHTLSTASTLSDKIANDMEKVRRKRMQERFKAREDKHAKTSVGGAAPALGSTDADAIEFFKNVQEDMQDEVKTMNMIPSVVFDVQKAVLVTVGRQTVDVMRDFGGIVHDDISRGLAIQPEKAHAYKPPQHDVRL